MLFPHWSYMDISTARPIRVFLAEDNALVRQTLKSVLKAYPNIEVIGEASDGDEALAGMIKLHPTVVVMDINMHKMDGITATRLIKAQYPEIVIVGLTAAPKDYQIYAMQKAGASEVLDKDTAGVQLYSAIQRAVAAVQPVLIMEEPTALENSPADSSAQRSTSD
jgi:DNA-binding NarL/FixJ family response regulator